MIVTENEATSLNCKIINNEYYDKQGWGNFCDGSNCMHWRWAEPEFITTEKKDDGYLYSTNPRPRNQDEPRRGYCGLAGKPDYE